MDHLFHDKPLYVLPLDITQWLITKNGEQVTSYKVFIAALRSKRQCGQIAGSRCNQSGQLQLVFPCHTLPT